MPKTILHLAPNRDPPESFNCLHCGKQIRRSGMGGSQFWVFNVSTWNRPPADFQQCKKEE